MEIIWFEFIIYNIFQFEDYVLEKTLGTWFMLLPKKKEKDEKILEINQKILVSPYDIDDTLLDMLGFGCHQNYKIYTRKR